MFISGENFLDVVDLSLIECRTEVSKQSLCVSNAERRSKQVLAPTISAKPKLQVCIEPVSHSKKALVFG